MLNRSRKVNKERNVDRGSLVLARYPGEAIVIGDGIEIELMRITEGRAYIRIVAPKEVPIVRRELL